MLINISTTILLIMWGGVLMMSPMMIVSQGLRDSRKSIIMVMSFLGYPVIVFAIIKVLGFRYFGMSADGWMIGTGVVSAIVILIYGLPGMLLNIGQGIPNNGYFVAESAVYLDGRKISKADPKSFERFANDDRYARDLASVFYYGQVIAGADPKSFCPIQQPAEGTPEGSGITAFWKDGMHVYYNGTIIKGADAKSFRLITGVYGVDASRVYFTDQVLEGAVPDKFRFVGEGIATDGDGIYIYGKRSKTVVNLESFTLVEGEHERFCRDRDHVYLIFLIQAEPLVKVEGADPATFITLERSYARDKNNVYFFGNYQNKGQQVVKLAGANPETFTIGYDHKTRTEAYDGNRYYMYGEVVKQR